MKKFYLITDDELRELRDVMRTATMERASFLRIGPDGDKDNSIDELIKERTRLWRVTWIIDPLQDIVEAVEKRETKPRNDNKALIAESRAKLAKDE